MTRCPPRLLHLIAIPVATLGLTSCGGPEKKIEEKLAANILFFANFDDRSRFEALTKKKGTVAAMETSSPPRHEFTGGKEDGFVSFANDATYLSYQAKENFPYGANSPWSGGVSFWLSVDPNSDFTEKFPEPFSIGKKWDDAVIFVDFEKSQKDRPPSALRFGCYPDKTRAVSEELVKQWTIRYDKINWKSDQWHHIVVTWSNINSGNADAEYALFVGGEEIGRKKNIKRDITWDMDNMAIRFNNYKTAYAGKIDEIAIFNTMLDPADVIYLYKPKRPLNVLLKKDR
jgi:hypothetical protein